MTSITTRAKTTLLCGGVLMIACTPKANAPEAPAADEAPLVVAKNETPPAEAAPQPATAPLSDKDMQEAKAVFAQRCTLCHGMEGKGNGPASATLSPRPRDYTDPEWQKSITDAQLRLVILEGGPALHKSMMMPANPDLKDKPQVVEGLVKIVRGLKRAS